MSGFSFGVTVRVELLHANEMRFPAVTVCNMSPVRKSAAVRMAQQKQAAAEQVHARKKKRKRKKRASMSCPKLLSYGFVLLVFISGKFGFDSDDRRVAVSPHFTCTFISTIENHTDSVKLS